jgi:putative transposase
MIIRKRYNIFNDLAEVIMSKRVSSQDTRPTLTAQMRQVLITTLKSHLPLEIQGRALDDEMLWDILVYASVNGIMIESACNELDDVPAGNTVRDHMRDAFDPSCFGVYALEDALNASLQRQLPVCVLRRRKRKGWEVGIDLTDIPYHGKPAQIPEEIGRGAAKSGTTHFHRYATLAIVHHHQRYEVAITFVWAGESMDQVVDRLLDQARHLGLRLRRAYLDKGFCRREVFSLLRQRRLPYLIPIPVKGKSGGIRQLFTGRKSDRSTYTFNANKPQEYTTDVIIIRRYSKGRYGRHRSEWFVYAAYGMDSIPLNQIFDLYRRRFGMESGYRQLHQVRARTTSPNPTWRLLLVGLGFLLYNVYILFRQRGQTTQTYGKRSRRIGLTLGRMKRMIHRFLEQKFGIVEMDPLLNPG